VWSCLALGVVLSCLVLFRFVLSCLFLGVVSSCFVLSCLVMSCLVVSCRVLSCLVVSCLVLSCLVFCYLFLPFFVLSCLVLSFLIFSWVVSSYLVFCLVVFMCTYTSVLPSSPVAHPPNLYSLSLPPPLLYTSCDAVFVVAVLLLLRTIFGNKTWHRLWSPSESRARSPS
jgi:hypothetical protein